MIDISKTSQTTIIITTHYIEEARKADRVGLMRNGKILAEQSPEYLLQRYNQPVCFLTITYFICNENYKYLFIKSLEDVFLNLCMRDQETYPSTSALANPNYEDSKDKVK